MFLGGIAAFFFAGVALGDGMGWSRGWAERDRLAKERERAAAPKGE